MSVTLFGLKNCDTCKKALKALETAGKTVNFKDIRADGFSDAQLVSWLDAAGRTKLVNTRSTTWRGLSKQEQTLDTDEDVLALLKHNPTLIKRPVIEAESGIYVGWSKLEQAALT